MSLKLPRGFGVLAAIMVLSLTADAGAQPERQLLEELDERISLLEAGRANEVAPAEVSRARDLWRRAMSALESGDEGVAGSIARLIPLHIELIDDLLRAAAIEGRADDAEGRLAEIRERARAERAALERVLERLARLTVSREEE